MCGAFVCQVLQMELMFSKLASLEADAKASNKATNGVGGGGAEEEGGEREEEDALSLEPVSVQRFETSLSGGHWGLHAYVPVTFSGVHFVRVDCMVGLATNGGLLSTVVVSTRGHQAIWGPWSCLFRASSLSLVGVSFWFEGRVWCGVQTYWMGRTL